MMVINGCGTAEFRGNSSCRVEFQVTDTVTGETMRMRKTYPVKSKTKAEKDRCKRDFRAEIESAGDPSANPPTFGEYSAEWLSQRIASPNLGEGTKARDKERIATLNLTFGNMLVSGITRQDVKRWQTAIMSADGDGKAPTLSGRPVCGATAHDLRTALNMILEEARRDGLTRANPCADLKAPAVDTREKEPLTLDQVRRFKAALDRSEPTPTRAALRLCLFGGLRRGEAAALQWRDFDPKAGTVSVSKTFVQASKTFGAPKTKAGNRTVELDADTVAYLARLKALQAHRLVGSGADLAELRICAELGSEYVHPANIARALRRFCDKYGLPSVSPHVLRHTYCTMLVASGCDIKTIQKQMGHEDVKTTLQIYSHYCESNAGKARAAMDALLSGDAAKGAPDALEAMAI